MKQYNIIALLVFLGALAWIFFLAPESTAGLRSNFLSWFSPVVKAAGAVQGEADPADSRSREELLAEVEKLGAWWSKAEQPQFGAAGGGLLQRAHGVV